MKIEVKKVAGEELKNLGVDSWGSWSCDISEFDWKYDSDERCYIQEGRVIVTTEEGEKVEINKGDLVLFPKGLKCSWNILEPIKKVYRFE
ncbi:MAG: cupin domain-containing protein [Candidatus Kaelpia imicola]|nr:cupin domain-containing protein [Candidatus Kaelpia imicola]